MIMSLMTDQVKPGHLKLRKKLVFIVQFVLVDSIIKFEIVNAVRPVFNACAIWSF